MKESEEKVIALTNETELLLKQRDSALKEAHLWRSELEKAREHAVVLEAAVLRADERARVSQADAEAKLKFSAEKELAAAKEREELLAYVNILRSQVQRFAPSYFLFECYLHIYTSKSSLVLFFLFPQLYILLFILCCFAQLKF